MSGCFCYYFLKGVVMHIATIKGFGLFTSPDYLKINKKTKTRKIKYFEFEYTISAKGCIFLDKKKYEIQNNMVYIKKPGQVANSIVNMKCFYLYLELDQDSEYYDLLINIPTIYQIIDKNKYNVIFESLIKHLTMTNSANDDYINSKLLELFYFLKKDKEQNRFLSSISIKKFNQTISKSIEYINEHFNEKLDLKTLSSMVGYSQNYYQHIFKSIMGITPQKYILEVRISNAKYLMSLQDLSILEISERCGFDSQAYFGCLFKKYTNYTPKEYRKMLLSSYY